MISDQENQSQREEQGFKFPGQHWPALLWCPQCRFERHSCVHKLCLNMLVERKLIGEELENTRSCQVSSSSYQYKPSATHAFHKSAHSTLVPLCAHGGVSQIWVVMATALMMRGAGSVFALRAWHLHTEACQSSPGIGTRLLPSHHHKVNDSETLYLFRIQNVKWIFSVAGRWMWPNYASVCLCVRQFLPVYS